MFNTLYRSAVQLLNNLRLKTKFMLSYFILIMIPLGLLTFLSYNQVSKYIENQVQYSAKQAFEQTNSFLAYKIEKIINVMDIISLDKNLHDILLKPHIAYTIPDQMKDMDILTRYLRSFQKASDVYSVKLYIDSNLLYANEGINLYNLANNKNSKWYRHLLSNNSNITFSTAAEMSEDNPESLKTVSVLKGIKDFNNYNRNIGVLRLDILEGNIQDIIRKANTINRGVAYLKNEEGTIIATSNPNLPKEWHLDPGFCEDLSNKSSNWSIMKINNDDLNIGCKKVEGTDWYLISIIPHYEIVSSSINIRNQMLILLLITATLAYILAYFISSSTTKRINQLIRRMKKVQNGDLDAIIANKGKDEIGELIENFNYMIEKIAILVKDQYKSGLEVKSAELKALQAQINPHFLYNTLDLINWTAIKSNVPEISSIVKSLAGFYKLSLSKGKDIVTIKDEIDHISLYVDIQNKRFNGGIKLVIDIRNEVYNYCIPKIILQPIVENSILHGIMEKEDCTGKVAITGDIQNGIIILTVNDNGAGMSEEKLKSIYNGSISDTTGSYGLSNIDNRIKLYFGDRYGLTFSSTPGKGTEVTIVIPALKQTFQK